MTRAWNNFWGEGQEDRIGLLLEGSKYERYLLKLQHDDYLSKIHGFIVVALYS